MKKINKCKKILYKISKEKSSKKRNLLIKNAQKCVINSISEISLNCLLGNVPLTKCQFKNLKKYRLILRQLAKKSSVKKRKDLLIQSGGFINLLIPPVLSLLSSIAGTTIAKYINKKN